MLFKLAAEMFGIKIAALFSNLVYGASRVLQLILCQKKPILNDIVHTGNTEPLLINLLQVSRTDMELLCHFRNAPWRCRIVFYVHVKLQQLQFPKIIRAA